MKTKTLWLLTGLFVVILVLTGLTILGPSFLARQQSPYVKQLKGAKGEGITLITLNKGDERVELNRENDTWRVNGKKAQNDAVGELIQTLIDKPSTQLIAQTSAQHDQFGVASSSATTIVFGDLLTLLVGGQTVGGTYVRIEGSDNVFLVSGATDLMLSTSISDWYDKTIVEIDESKLQKVTLKQKEEIILIKKDDKWVVEGVEDTTDETKVRSVASQFTRFFADLLVDDAAKRNSYAQQPKLTVTLTYDGGSEILTFFEGKNNWLVERASDKELFTVSQSQVEDLLTPRKDFLTTQ